MRRLNPILSVAILLIPFLAAEDIQLKDGSKITGTLTGIKGDTFEVKTAYGNISVPRSQVLTITFPENQPKTVENSGASVPSVEESLEGLLYTNRTAGFTLSIPKGWKLAPGLRSKDIVAALQSDDETLFVLVTPEKFNGPRHL